MGIAYRTHSNAAISAQYVQIWSKKFWKDATAQTFFRTNMVAKGAAIGGGNFGNAVVEDLTALLNGPMKGDTVQVNQTGKLKGIEKTGTLTAYEEKIQRNYWTMGIGRKRHAVGYEKFSEDKAFWQIKDEIGELFTPWYARYIDRMVMRTMISGTTAVYNGTVTTLASAGAAAMATGGLVVAALDKLAVSLEAKGATPINITGAGEAGQQAPAYPVLMPSDQYHDILNESGMKSAISLAYVAGADHPIRTAARIRYKNLYLFTLPTDLRDGGSPLQPMFKLYSAIATGSGVTGCYASTSGSAAVLTKYLPSSGYIVCYNQGATTKKEYIHYTSKTNYKLTMSRTAGSRTSHVAAASVVAQGAAHILGLGAGVIAKVERPPVWIEDTEDYGEIIGRGMRWIDGYKKIDDTFDATNGIYLLNVSNDRSLYRF